MTPQPNRILVVDPVKTTSEVLARRLRAQGYTVDEASSPAAGAEMALRAPPAAVVADLWMPSISGVQLCRLLRTEPATAEVPVILCGEADEPRNRFWAERAGANAFVPKHRTGELVRALGRAVAAKKEEPFFFQLSGGVLDVHDRIARHLDAALFDSVIAAEVRALATCCSFERLFDMFAQFFSQVSRYRWLAMSTSATNAFAIHHHAGAGDAADAEARAALGVPAEARALRIEDCDASGVSFDAPPVVRAVHFGEMRVGQIALAPCMAVDSDMEALLTLVARELGGAIRIAELVEESQRRASTDVLTGLGNRRAFVAAMEQELARSQRQAYPLSVALVDVDHFKVINDRHGHAAGDRVLTALGRLLGGALLRRTDLAARWGGEEFVVAYLDAPCDGALTAAERLRRAIEALVVTDETGDAIPVTASIGVAELRAGETLDSLVGRADRAMYASKAAGRNRVTAHEALAELLAKAG